MIKHYIFVLKKKYDRYIHDPIIAVVTIPLFMVLKLLPYTISSDLCGIIFKKIGPLTKYQTRINNNLRFAFPNKKSKELDFISRECWYNFGQIVGELPHIDTIIKKNKLKTVGLNKIKKGPAILICAHIGNWEFLLRVAELAGRRAGFVYRPINNWILNKIQINRNSKIDADFFQKGRLAAIGMANKLKRNEIIGLTNDQMLREGIMVPFFGKKTPTPQAAAMMAIRWNVPIHMVRVKRIKKFSFLMTIEDKLKFVRSNDNQRDIYLLTCLISKRIEEWIEETPEQWLWAHRRWGK